MEILVPSRVRARQRLYGLGQAPAPVSLLNGPDGRFSNTRFEELKKILYDALADTDAQFERVRKVATSAAESFGVAKLSPTITAGQTILQYLPGAKQRLLALRARVDAAARDVNSPLWNAAPTYRKVTAFQVVLDDIKFELAALDGDLQILKDATDQTLLSALGDRALEMVREAYEYAKQAGSGALEIIEDAAKAAKSNVSAGLWFAKNWYWIVGAAIVIPFGIRAYLQYKEGGSRAALKYTAEGIERGREAAAEGAKKAGAAATKAGSAYASGGASLAVSGLRRRRRKARR